MNVSLDYSVNDSEFLTSGGVRVAAQNDGDIDGASDSHGRGI